MAHSNELTDGKGVGGKAHDCLAAIACDSCHRWYDIGPDPADTKRDVFNRALKRTLVVLCQQGLLVPKDIGVR